MCEDSAVARGKCRELQEAYRLLEARGSEARAAQAALLAEHFEPLAEAVVSANRAPPGSSSSLQDACDAVICVAGPRVWPTVLVPAWARPRAVLLLRLERPLDDAPGGSLPAAVARVTGLSLDAIEQQWIAGQGEVALYEEVRDFIVRGGFDPSRVLIEASGAGPAASAASAMVAEVSGARFAAVLGGSLGGGLPGTERLRVLAGPLERFGDGALARVREAFEGGRYAEAERQAERLGRRLFAPREAEVLRRLAAGFGAWHRFDFCAARAPLDEALELLRQHRDQGGWTWAEDLEGEVARAHASLCQLAALPSEPSTVADGLPAILNHLVAARRALAQDDLDDALLLLHGTVERWIDLLLRCEFEIDTSGPERLQLPDEEAEARFHVLGQGLFARYTPLPPQGPLLYLRAAQALGALAPERILPGDVGWIRGLGRLRNDLAHALVPTHPTARQLQPKFEAVEAWLARQLPTIELQAELARFVFPQLAASSP